MEREYKVGDRVMNDGEEVEIKQILSPKCAGPQRFFVDAGYVSFWVDENEVKPALKSRLARALQDKST